MNTNTPIFQGFEAADFAVFHIDGLDPRMDGIRSRIQPKFKELGEELCDEIAMMAGTEMFVHIAKHARRKVNPPIDTWMSFCHSKRGYKMFPHFQIGLFDDRVFLWLAYIYELPEKQHIASRLLERINEVYGLIPDDFHYSFDHMNKNAITARELQKEGLKQAIERFRDVKKAELLIGRLLSARDPLLQNGPQFVEWVNQTFETLMPVYKLSV